MEKSNACHTSRYRHLHLLWGWAGFFLFYFLTENLIPLERCHVIHCALDDLIPFHEFFVIFYVGWYLLLALSLGYFLFCRVESFKRLQTYIIIVQALAMVVYLVYPSRQELRPETFSRENFLTAIMGYIYAIDTPTGVCPSLHVAISAWGFACLLPLSSSIPWWIFLRQFPSAWLQSGFCLFAGCILKK